MAGNNISENILGSSADLQGEIQWQNYIDKNLFTHYCDLIADHRGERINVSKIHDKSLTNIEGIVYVFVIAGRILTFGQSIQTFKGRLGSYNSGTKKLRKRNTTNSVTNYFIVQSILKINLPVQVYVMTPQHRPWNELGETGTEPFPSAKIWKRILLAKFFKQYKKRPIGNPQK